MSENGLPKNLAEALLNFQAEVPTLPKDAENPHFKSKFTPLDTIVEVVRPLLTKNRLVWTALPGRDSTGEPGLRYKLMHVDSGETLEGTMPLMLVKDDPQSQGSALTYARRYSMSAVLDLVADEDDDGNRAQPQDGKSGFAKEKPKKWATDLLKKAALDDEQKTAVAKWAYQDGQMLASRASEIIDFLKTKNPNASPTAGQVNTLLAAAGYEGTDLPADEEGLPELTEEQQDKIGGE